MKAIPTLIGNIYEALGAKSCFEAMECQGEKEGYKYSNCKTIEFPSFNKFQRLIAYVGQNRSVAAFQAAFALGDNIFAPVRARMVDTEVIGAIVSGRPLISLIGQQDHEFCKSCNSPVQFIKVCTTCQVGRR